MERKEYIDDAVALLRQLIETPRVSRTEGAATDIMEQWMKAHTLAPKRCGNNILLVDPEYDPALPTVLLNAHIDTVKPVASWTRNPNAADIEGDKLYGIGSNDCGGGLVTLLQVYRWMIAERKKIPMESAFFNILYLASAEEEVSGIEGIRKVIPLLPQMLGTEKPTEELVSVAIVGEPTSLQPAVAEKGLMVIDMTAHGKSGHAARNEGVNAIYKALDDMLWIRDYRFEKVSPFLGPTKMQVTVVNSGTQHNVVPDECKMIVDVRSNEYYDNAEIFDFIDKNTQSECKARSFHLRSSRIETDHPLIRRCVEMGMEPFGSPTLSDQALMPWPSFKLGPGDSSRSHSADEFIRISEIEKAFDVYTELLATFDASAL